MVETAGNPRHHGRRIQLEEGQVVHSGQQVGRPVRVEQLGPDRDLPSFDAVKTVP